MKKCPKGPQNTGGTAFRLVSDLISHAQFKMFRHGQSRYPGWNVYMGIISSSVTEILVAKTEISVTGPARLHIWTHQNFWKEKSGEARSRIPSQPGRPGSYEEALCICQFFATCNLLTNKSFSLFKHFSIASAGILVRNECVAESAVNTCRRVPLLILVYLIILFIHYEQ